MVAGRMLPVLAYGYVAQDITRRQMRGERVSYMDEGSYLVHGRSHEEQMQVYGSILNTAAFYYGAAKPFYGLAKDLILR